MVLKLTSLRRKAEECLKDWDFDILYYNTIFRKGDAKDTFVEEISNGSAGIYQGEDIINAFGLWDFVEDKDDLDEQWEVILKFAEELGELITEVMRNKYGLKGVYYFSYLPDCGDYGLFYREVEEDE